MFLSSQRALHELKFYAGVLLDKLLLVLEVRLLNIQIQKVLQLAVVLKNLEVLLIQVFREQVKHLLAALESPARRHNALDDR
jgi:hypothetical protein